MTKEGPLGARKPYEPSRMKLHGPISVDDVLQALVGRTARIPSNMIAQPVKVTNLTKQDFASDEIGGVSMRKPATIQDPWRAMDEAEQAIGREIGVLRCLADLATLKHTTTRRMFSLLEIYRKVPERAQGELVILCLRAYHEWASNSKERALAEVWVWAQRLEGVDFDASALAQEFREGKSAKLRKRAASYYADAFLILGEFVRIWNRKCWEPLNNT